ncbi:hypothetical protein QVD17_02056 [Tagetes erecta]|uniref:Uncharacterized protein n=1 Tax=Tagetes erecta TaxID=13708 RepID=A0AAD8P8P5_TARER|nr:hypothetical protein QVD17_02056 [Tagetes erecta]
MATKQVRGFRIRLKLVYKLFKCVFHERQNKRSTYTKLKSTNYTDKAMARLCKFGKSLKRSVKELCCFKSGFKYGRIDEKACVPRGHLAVYFGEEEDDVCRVLVPVIYFNHPFFGELLKEAEKVYGHDHCGGIHVPCRLSEFEEVENRICAAGGCGGGYGGSWRSWLGARSGGRVPTRGSSSSTSRRKGSGPRSLLVSFGSRSPFATLLTSYAPRPRASSTPPRHPPRQPISPPLPPRQEHNSSGGWRKVNEIQTRRGGNEVRSLSGEMSTRMILVWVLAHHSLPPYEEIERICVVVVIREICGYDLDKFTGNNNTPPQLHEPPTELILLSSTFEYETTLLVDTADLEIFISNLPCQHVSVSPSSEWFSNPSTLNGSEGMPLTDSEVISFRGATKHYQGSDRFRGHSVQSLLKGYQTALSKVFPYLSNKSRF